MVLQRDMPVPVWGTAAEGERVTVEFGGQRAATTAEDGKWMVRLRKMKASATPSPMTITGSNSLASTTSWWGKCGSRAGSRNMQWSVNDSAEPQSVIAGSADPQMRLFTVPRIATDEPLAQFPASGRSLAPPPCRSSPRWLTTSGGNSGRRSGCPWD
jgi:sialate O-acetylesterase